MEISDSKAKTTSKNKKPAARSKPTKSKKVNVLKSLPGENEIRQKAQEIYNKRILSGEHGTAEEDWLQAERLLKG
jgi:hypothetical protein